MQYDAQYSAMHVSELIKVPIGSFLHGGKKGKRSVIKQPKPFHTLSDDEIYMAWNSEHNKV